MRAFWVTLSRHVSILTNTYRIWLDQAWIVAIHERCLLKSKVTQTIPGLLSRTLSKSDNSITDCLVSRPTLIICQMPGWQKVRVCVCVCVWGQATPQREENKWLVKGLLNTAVGAVLSHCPLCNDMVRKCFLWPAARDTALTSDMKADGHIYWWKCNYIRYDISMYWLQTSKRM